MNKYRAKIIKSPYIQILKCFAFVSGVILFSTSYAGNAIEKSTKTLRSVQKLTVDSVNLTAKDFFAAYISESADDRKNAELYLLGVMDATEGKSWCDYKTYKTITLRERIFISFNNLESNQLSERAAKVIENILSQRYPCRNVK